LNRSACRVSCLPDDGREIGGGALLLFGSGTRWVALALIPLILGTIYLVHGKNGWLFSNKDGGWEYPAFWAVGPRCAGAARRRNRRARSHVGLNW
jgi:hypothetical protein